MFVVANLLPLDDQSRPAPHAIEVPTHAYRKAIQRGRGGPPPEESAVVAQQWLQLTEERDTKKRNRKLERRRLRERCPFFFERFLMWSTFQE